MEIKKNRIIDSKFLSEKINEFLSMSFFELAVVANDHNRDSFSVLMAQGLLKSHARGENMTVTNAAKFLLELQKEMATFTVPILSKVKTFEEFCADAGYPAPFPKQNEMRNFVLNGDGVRMLLGSRGYGKTDYTVILGLSYELYLEHVQGAVQDTAVLITKSDKKNTQIMREVARVLEANDVPLEVSNADSIRVAGLTGKDDSLSALTIGSASFRGRHPNRILFDDPVTPEDTSEAVRSRAKIVYNEAFKLCSNISIIGQPAHKFDLYEELRNTIRCMEVPHGTIPELDHDLSLQRLGGVDEESIQSSYFLKVSSENASPFATAQSIDEFPRTNSAAFIDPSFKGIDYTAMSIAAGYFSGVAVEGYVRKKAWNHCIEEYLEICKKLNVKRLCIETNSLGDMPVTLIRNMAKTICPGLGVSGRNTTSEKHARIVNAGTFAENIHISKKSDKLYIDHVTKYEYGAKFDDAPDSLASLLEWIGLVRPKGKR